MSGIWERFKKALDSRNTKEITPNEPTPQEALGHIKKEIQQAIQKNKVLLQQTKECEQDVQKKVREYTYQAQELYQKASLFLKQGKENEAGQCLQQKTMLDEQIKDFSKMHQNVSQSIHQIEAQIHKQELQLQELVVKGNVLATQLQVADSQKHINQQMENMPDSVLDELEAQVAHKQLEANIHQDSFDAEYDKMMGNATENIAAAAIQKEIQEQEKTQKERHEKKIAAALQLDTSASQKELETERKKQQAMIENLQQQTQQKPKNVESMVQDFFTTTTTNVPAVEIPILENNTTADAITTFFETNTKTPPATTNKDSIEDFFKEKETPTIPKKSLDSTIEDFFK